MNNDHPENGLSTGDWETINSFGERSVCGNPTGVQAYPIDKNAGSTAVTHIGRFKILHNNKFFGNPNCQQNIISYKGNLKTVIFRNYKPLKMKVLDSGVSMTNNPMVFVLTLLFDFVVRRNGGIV